MVLIITVVHTSPTIIPSRSHACGPCARDCRNLLFSLSYYITTQAATQAVTKGNCIAVRNQSNRRGGLAAVNDGKRVHCCDVHWANPFIQSQADATRPSYELKPLQSPFAWLDAKQPDHEDDHTMELHTFNRKIPNAGL